MVVAVGEAPREGIDAVRVRADDDPLAAELAVAGHDRGRRICLAGNLAKAARVDFERGSGVDEGPQDRFVQLGRARELLFALGPD